MFNLHPPTLCEYSVASKAISCTCGRVNNCTECGPDCVSLIEPNVWYIMWVDVFYDIALFRSVAVTVMLYLNAAIALLYLAIAG